jgi:hypothetical protein
MGFWKESLPPPIMTATGAEKLLYGDVMPSSSRHLLMAISAYLLLCLRATPQGPAGTRSEAWPEEAIEKRPSAIRKNGGQGRRKCFKITAMGEEEEFPERWRARADFTALLA